MNRVGTRPALRIAAPIAPPLGGRPLKGTDPALVTAAVRLLKSGGAGTWFKSVSPFGDGKPQSFFLVKRWPAKADPKSPMLLMRTEPTRAFLDGITKAGTPLVLGTIPLAAGVGAAALGSEVQLAGDALKAGAIKNHSSAVLLQPSADKFVVAHELQHWKDFEAPKLTAAFEAGLKAFPFDAGEKSQLVHLMWELRGHNAQALQAVRDEAAHVPYLDGAGNVITRQPKLRDDYQFQRADAASIFGQAYDSTAFHLVGKLRQKHPAQVKALGELFAKFDLSGERGAPLGFARYTGG